MLAIDFHNYHGRNKQTNVNKSKKFAIKTRILGAVVIKAEFEFKNLTRPNYNFSFPSKPSKNLDLKIVAFHISLTHIVGIRWKEE